MAIIQNSIFFCRRLCRLAFSWRHRPQITLYIRTLFSRITSLICFFFLNMYILLPTIEYVHNINGTSCGMIGTLEHFGYCVDAESVDEFVAGFTAVNVVSVSAYTGYCLLWSVAPVLYGWSKQPNKAGSSPKWFSWLTSYVVLKIKKKKPPEDFVKPNHKNQPYHCSLFVFFLKIRNFAIHTGQSFCCKCAHNLNHLSSPKQGSLFQNMQGRNSGRNQLFTV